MPKETIDTLALEIDSDAGSAADGLDRLAKALSGVNNVLDSAQPNLSKYAIDISNFSKAVNGLKGLKFPDFSKLHVSSDLGKLGTLAPGLSSFADAAKKFESVNASSINKSVRALEKISSLQGLKNLANLGDFSGLIGISQSISVFADAALKLSTLNTRQINNTVTAFEKLSGVNLQGFASNVAAIQGIDFSAFVNLGNAFQSFLNSLAGSEKVSAGVPKILTAISQLAASSGSIPSVTSALPGLSTAVLEFVNTMATAQSVNAGTVSVVTALSGITQSGSKAQKAAEALHGITEGVREFIVALSKTPVLSNNVVKAVQALAQFSSAGSRAGSAAGSLQTRIKSLSGSFNILKGSVFKGLSGVKSFTKQILSAAGIAGGLYTAFRGLKASIDISSDLKEVQNVVDVTFADMKSKVEDLAKTSIGDFGMSELTVKQISSRFQAMGVAMGYGKEQMSDMSIQLTKLAADMASFYNIGQKAVAQDLEAIFTGQTRPLRAYGIDITEATLSEWALKQGIDANIKSMTQAEKAMLRYNYVLENSSAAHGDFARTSGRLCAA